ncbi:extracellular solute-binding protein [Lichenihabitans psoromatis]|uniref:extracellular solute-binding protein n=1 Tax=Lichenihabitans psoromatis TaxID=2528642 RepID=UPI0010383E33|nr:extracellular solute-binding protein [Lichenihabitans psoromatis]
MQTKIVISLAAAALMGCGAVAPAHAAGDLFIYNWTDYTAPDVIKKFEKETGIKVTLDTYDSNETLLAKLKSGSAGYDIVVVSSDFVPIFAKEGLIQKIDGPKIPGYDNIDAKWKSPAWDKDNEYSVPYDWGVTAFTVNTKFVKDPGDSLKLLFSPPEDAKGKVGMFGAPSEVMSLAEVYLGMTPCQTDPANMKKVSDLLEAQAPSVKVYNSDGIIDRQGSGETWIHQAWNGDAARTRAVNPDVHFIFPKEGVVGWMDNMAVPTSAKDPDNAKLFIKFMMQPENSAMSSNFTHYASGIAGAEKFYDPAMKDAPELKVPADLKMQFTPACPEAATKLMDRVWTKLKK